MTFEEDLNYVKRLVEVQLKSFFKSKRKEAVRRFPQAVVLTDQIADLTLRDGKRTRAYLVYLGFKAVSGSEKPPSKKLISLMVAVELFQSFALIHDDIIDEDDQRRGGPSVHRYFSIQFGRPKHFGESMAILAGDLAFSWAIGLVNDAASDNVRKIFNRMAEETIIGQGLDVLYLQAEEEIEKTLIDELKTAYYSVARPLILGAALSGAEEKVIRPLENYGLAVGRAYQLRDDFLDKKLSESDFRNSLGRLLSKADESLELLSLKPDIKYLFNGFTQFVVKRQK